MDTTSRVAPPSYATTAADNFLKALGDLPFDEARIKACEVMEHLKRRYQFDSEPGSAPPLSERSVSSPLTLSPIEKLMEKEQNNDLVKGLNSLVRGFNREIADFHKKIENKDDGEIVQKACGLTKIGNYMKKDSYSGKQNKLSNDVTLQGSGLLVNSSDYSRWFIAVHRLSENTLQCHTTDLTTYHENNHALILFLDKLLATMSVEDPSRIEDIDWIINDLKRGKPYLTSHESTLGDTVSFLLTHTIDVKVFRDTLDALFTLYQFTPYPEPLTEITTEFNNTINSNAKRSGDYCMYR